MKVRVTTINVATGDQVGNSRVINYDRPASRQWLAKHCYWAYHNGYGVVSNNVDDEPKPEYCCPMGRATGNEQHNADCEA